MSKTIVFGSCKGGTAKSSTCHAVATVLEKMGKSVLVLDLDSQMNLTTGMGVEIDQTKNIYNAISAIVPIEDCIRLVPNHKSLYIIPGSRRMLSQYFVSADDITLIRETIEIIDQVHPVDYVLIDVGPESGSIMTLALLAADYVVGMATCSEFSFDGIIQLISDMRDGAKKYVGFKAKPLGILLTNIRRTNVVNINREKFYQLADAFAAPFKTEISSSCLMDECKEFHISINEYKPSSVPARQYYAVTEEMLERIDAYEQA